MNDAIPPHPLLSHLLAAADGSFPPVDGECTVLPALARGLECSFGFTGHAFIATALSPDVVRQQRPDGYGGSHAPDFLRWLAGQNGQIGVVDATLVGRGAGPAGPAGGARPAGPAGGAGSTADGGLPERSDLHDHPRVRLAANLREQVQVFGDQRGLVTLSVGLAGRREISVEAAPQGQGRGWGRSLLIDALKLVPAGEAVFAAVSPGNARSLRMFLGLGFVPIGSEVIVRPDRS